VAKNSKPRFAGKFNSFPANVAKAGKVVYFVRRPAPEVREDGLGLGVRRRGQAARGAGVKCPPASSMNFRQAPF